MAKDPSLQDDIVKRLAYILNEANLTEIEYEFEGCRIKVVKQPAINHINMAPSFSAPTHIDPRHNAQLDTLNANTKSDDHLTPNTSDVSNAQNTIKSPMVGTAYLASTPESPPFISVGTVVKKGQTLLIIEAMKVMNQIKSPFDGTIKQIYVHNSDPIEYGQPLVVFE